jgi:hypothetical protein
MGFGGRFGRSVETGSGMRFFFMPSGFGGRVIEEAIGDVGDCTRSSGEKALKPWKEVLADWAQIGNQRLLVGGQQQNNNNNATSY